VNALSRFPEKLNQAFWQILRKDLTSRINGLEVNLMKLPDFYAYPAIFTTDGDGWEVSFPDVDNAFTAADTLEQAIIEAQYVLEDIMYLREKNRDDINVSLILQNAIKQELRLH
jgi:predicted RNase H-like HicB family nuclease